MIITMQLIIMIRWKIFQPFFIIMPTGEGTGLELSLRYDIIRAPGGDIKVESIEGAVVNLTYCCR